MNEFYRRFVLMELIVLIGVWKEAVDMFYLSDNIQTIGLVVLVILGAIHYYVGYSDN